MGTKKTTNITITNMMSERNICFPVSCKIKQDPQSVTDYIETLAGKKIPESSCIQYIKTNYQYNKNVARLTERNRKENMPKNSDDKYIELLFGLKNGPMCFYGDCIKNIAAGTCRDKFVIKHIGLKFFANKYTKTK